MRERHVRPEVAALVDQLPLKLRLHLTLANGKESLAQLLALAIDEHLIALTDDGHLAWLDDNKTLLAYFCGRVWCGDSASYHPKKDLYRWMSGKRDFPEKDLSALFCTLGLRGLRRQRIFCTPPEGFQFVDMLIDAAVDGI